jgi:HEAT repeat protein
VESYDPSSMPSHAEELKVTDQIAGARPEDVSNALPAIFAVLATRDVNVQRYAASALFRISRRPDAAQLLKGYIAPIADLFNQPDERLQATPVLVFANFPVPTAEILPSLLAFLRREDRDPKAQTDAIRYLARQAPDNPDAVSVIQAFMLRPLDAQARIGVLQAFATPRIKDSRLIGSLIAFLDDPNLFVRLTAVQTLIRIGPIALRRAEPVMQRQVSDMVALVRKRDADLGTQVHIIYLLMDYAPEDPEILAEIQEFLSRPLAPDPRRNALQNLGNPRLKDPTLIRLIINSLDDPDSSVRLSAIHALTRIGRHALLPARQGLERVFDDPKQSAQVRAAAKEALQRLNARP